MNCFPRSSLVLLGSSTRRSLTTTLHVDHIFLSLLFAVFACAAALDHKPHFVAEGSESFRWTGSEDYSGWDFVETAQVLICMGSKATTLATIQAQSLIAVTQASWNTLAGRYWPF